MNEFKGAKCVMCGKVEKNRDIVDLAILRFNQGAMCVECFSKTKADAKSRYLARMESQGREAHDLSNKELELEVEAERIRKSGKFFFDD